MFFLGTATGSTGVFFSPDQLIRFRRWRRLRDLVHGLSHNHRTKYKLVVRF